MIPEEIYSQTKNPPTNDSSIDFTLQHVSDNRNMPLNEGVYSINAKTTLRNNKTTLQKDDNTTFNSPRIRNNVINSENRTLKSPRLQNKTKISEARTLNSPSNKNIVKNGEKITNESPKGRLRNLIKNDFRTTFNNVNISSDDYDNDITVNNIRTSFRRNSSIENVSQSTPGKNKNINKARSPVDLRILEYEKKLPDQVYPCKKVTGSMSVCLY